MRKPAKKPNQVVLEILRHGPPDNQLLSKLTPYLTLCGNMGAETVYVPFDQLDYETRMDDISGEYADQARTKNAKLNVRLDDLGRRLTEMLEHVPGLAPSLANAQSHKSSLTHLRLVLTPRELSLLPFECINVPKGAPGGGNKLLLQTESPITLTREVRGVNGNGVIWPARPKILFAWAEPEGIGAVPWEAHALALRNAIEPWIDRRHQNCVKHGDKGDGQVLEQVKNLFTVIEHASLEAIRKACEKARYTHVHILAHGVSHRLFRDLRDIGVALDDGRGGHDLVDGQRLATALNIRRDDGGVFPAVVTLATCDSGQARSVVSFGGSIAHELHVAGVPFVVASQFPLSHYGSAVMAEELYKRLLRCEDPRTALHKVRRRLFAHSNRYHDWAAMVAYASLPADFDVQIGKLEYEMTYLNINRKLNEIDLLDDDHQTTPAKIDSRIKTIEKLSEELKALSKQLCEYTGTNSRNVGLQASTEKRKAEAFGKLAEAIETLKENCDPRIENYRNKSFDTLYKAHALYRKALCQPIDDWVDVYWVGVNFISLSLVLKLNRRIADTVSYEQWIAAKVACEVDLNRQARQAESAWRRASLAELYLIAAIVVNTPELRNPNSTGEWPLTAEAYEQEGIGHLEMFCEIVEPASFEFYSTKRQFERYLGWWGRKFNESNRAIAQKFAEKFELTKDQGGADIGIGERPAQAET